MVNNGIILKNITKRFGDTVAVNDMNLEIPANGFVSLLGPSGCGKTTTLRMIAGLESPTEGEIWIGDRLVFSAEKGIDVPASKRNIGFLFQNYALWPHMTVYENIAFGLKNLKWKKEAIRHKVDELCKLLRLTEYLDRYPSELSGGQQQRVAIARTLATDPEILLMDEPLSNLDAKLRLDMRAELKRLHSTTKATFVYVTHDQMEAMALSTCVCLMDRAVVQQFAPPLTLYGRPVNRFSADFVGNPAINFVNCDLTECDGAYCAAIGSASFVVHAEDQERLTMGGAHAVLGIRPEYVHLADTGIPAKVVSSFPYGMETTVVLSCLGTELRSVVFGSISYAEGEMVQISISQEKLIFFHPQSGEMLTLGMLEPCE